MLLNFLRLSTALALFLGHTNFYRFFRCHLFGIGPQNGQDYVIDYHQFSDRFLTDDGIHLNAKGHSKLAYLLAYNLSSREW